MAKIKLYWSIRINRLYPPPIFFESKNSIKYFRTFDVKLWVYVSKAFNSYVGENRGEHIEHWRRRVNCKREKKT